MDFTGFFSSQPPQVPHSFLAPWLIYTAFYAISSYLVFEVSAVSYFFQAGFWVLLLILFVSLWWFLKGRKWKCWLWAHCWSWPPCIYIYMRFLLEIVFFVLFVFFFLLVFFFFFSYRVFIWNTRNTSFLILWGEVFFSSPYSPKLYDFFLLGEKV